MEHVTQADLDLVCALFAGDRSAAKTPRPTLERIGRALPFFAERTYFEPIAVRQALSGVISDRLWTWVLQQINRPPHSGWPELAAGLIEAAALFCVALPRLDEVLKLWGIADLAAARRPPAIFALLYPSGPSRVYMRIDRSDALPVSGVTSLRWPLPEMWCTREQPYFKLDHPFEGLSGEAAFLARLVAALGPTSLPQLGPVGVTGVVEPTTGRIGAVTQIASKLRAFQQLFPTGLCFVPADGLAKELNVASRDGREPINAKRIVPVATVDDLLFKLGCPFDRTAGNSAWSNVADASAHLTDFAGDSTSITSAVELPLVVRGAGQDVASATTARHGRIRRSVKLRDERDERDEPPNQDGKDTDEDSRRPDLQALLGHIHALAVAADGCRAGGTVTALPGGGKSWLLRVTLHRLCAGDLRWMGPAILINARTLTPDRPLDVVVRTQLQKLDLVLDGRHATPWLLLDGLDELPPDLRASLQLDLRAWRGPYLVATRSLPEAFPGAVVADLPPLTDDQSDRLLSTLGQQHEATHGLPRRQRLPRFHPGPPERFREQRRRAVEVVPPGRQLRSTPFGCAMLAAVGEVKTSNGEPPSRADLMRRVIDRSLVRARERPGLARQLHFFAGAGVRFIGAAAWSMLRGRRAQLLMEDVVYAYGQVPEQLARIADFDLVAEHVGFLQVVGFGVREFTHKAFAEYCAAEYLRSQGSGDLSVLGEALALVGEPGPDEVMIYLGLLLEDASPLLRALLDNGHKPLASLTLATRLLGEVRNIDHSLVAAVVRERLRLVSWFPLDDHLLPSGLNDPHDLWAVIEQWQEPLRERWREVVAGCHPTVEAWLHGDMAADRKGVEFDFWESSSMSVDVHLVGDDRVAMARARRRIAEDLHALLRFDVPPRALALMNHVRTEIAEWSPAEKSRCKRQLERVVDSPDDLVRIGARKAWTQVATEDDLRERLLWLADPLTPYRTIERIIPMLDTIPLVRAGVLLFALRPGREVQCRREIWEHLEAGQIRTAWSLGWQSGVLGNADYLEPNGEFGVPQRWENVLYAKLLRDREPLARTRALIAWWDVAAGAAKSRNDEASEMLDRPRAIALEALGDPLPYLRFAAASLLLEASDGPAALSATWARGTALEQLLFLCDRLRCGTRVALDEAIAVLAENPEEAPSELHLTTPVGTFLRFRYRSIWQQVVSQLVRVTCGEAGGGSKKFVELIAVAGLLERADASLRKDLTNPSVRALAKSGVPSVRQWAEGERLRRNDQLLNNRNREMPEVRPCLAQPLQCTPPIEDLLGEPQFPFTLRMAMRINPHSGGSLMTEEEIFPVGTSQREEIARLVEERRKVAREVRAEGALEHAIAAVRAVASSKGKYFFDLNAVAVIVRDGGRSEALSLVKHLLWIDRIASHGVQELRRVEAINYLLASAGCAEVARRFGRLPEHALLELPDESLRLLVAKPEPWLEPDPGDAPGAVVDRVISRGADKEEVRIAFVRAALWGTEYWTAADAAIARLGGRRSSDVAVLLEVLRDQPASPSALAYLSELGLGEREVCEIWSGRGVPWWGPISTSHQTKKTRPQRSGSRA